MSNSRHRQRPRRLAAASPDRGPYRAARFGASRPALDRRRPEAWRDRCPSARRLLQRHRSAEVGSGRARCPLAACVISTLREHRLACPKGLLDLVFPNGAGSVENLPNILRRGLKPTQIAAGVVNKAGGAKYTGLHRSSREGWPAVANQLTGDRGRRSFQRPSATKPTMCLR